MSKSPIVVQLSVATVFPELNKNKKLDPNTTHHQVAVHPMKHLHFRKMELLADNKKMSYLMEALTGLSGRDIDELDIDDSAELTRTIMGYMRKYVELAKEMSA